MKTSIKKDYKKYKEFTCSSCKEVSTTRVGYHRKTTLCRKCINIKQTIGRHECYGTRLYYCWNNMKQRCSHPNASGYKNYGAIGISVCDEWKDFFKFKDWAFSNGYAENLEIDRINSHGNYEPFNCRWVDENTQASNTRLIYAHNKSGYRGASVYRGKWRSSIQVNNKSIKIGYYETAKMAAAMRDKYVYDNNLPHTTNFTTEELQEVITTYRKKIKEFS